MNAPFVEPKQHPKRNFAAMNGQVAKWRGECIQRFAELEETIETLLLALSAVPERGRKIDTGKHVGTAFKQLRELTASDGPYAGNAKILNEALEDIANWFDWRAHLTHGVLALWCDEDGKWLITSTHRLMGDPQIRRHALSWDDARELRKILDERTPTVREQARSLMKAVQKT